MTAPAAGLLDKIGQNFDRLCSVLRRTLRRVLPDLPPKITLQSLLRSATPLQPTAFLQPAPSNTQARNARLVAAIEATAGARAVSEAGGTAEHGNRQKFAKSAQLIILDQYLRRRFGLYRAVRFPGQDLPGYEANFGPPLGGPFFVA
jgi:hypothetical protein